MEQELSEDTFEVLRDAIRTAREHGCQTVARLKERLQATWPDRSEDINEALHFWAENIHRCGPIGRSRH